MCDNRACQSYRVAELHAATDLSKLLSSRRQHNYPGYNAVGDNISNQTTKQRGQLQRQQKNEDLPLSFALSMLVFSIFILKII
jgi:hypothetical protein